MIRSARHDIKPKSINGEVQPNLPPISRVIISTNIDKNINKDPTTSNPLYSSTLPISGKYWYVKIIATIPRGTVTKKIQCHPKYSVMSPPTPYPIESATVVASEIYPNIFPLTALGKLTAIIAGVMESNIAEPIP